MAVLDLLAMPVANTPATGHAELIPICPHLFPFGSYNASCVVSAACLSRQKA